MVQVISAQSEVDLPPLGWSIQLGSLALYLMLQLGPIGRVILLRWSRGQKLSLSHLIEAKPCGSHCFVTKVTNQISIQYNRMQDFLIKRCDLAPLASRAHYLTCFLCGGVKLSVKLREKHYTCLLEQAGGRAIDRLKSKGIDLKGVKVRTQFSFNFHQRTNPKNIVKY